MGVDSLMGRGAEGKFWSALDQCSLGDAGRKADVSQRGAAPPVFDSRGRFLRVAAFAEGQPREEAAVFYSSSGRWTVCVCWIVGDLAAEWILSWHLPSRHRSSSRWRIVDDRELHDRD